MKERKRQKLEIQSPLLAEKEESKQVTCVIESIKKLL